MVEKCKHKIKNEYLILSVKCSMIILKTHKTKETGEGIQKVIEECLLSAIKRNLKRLVKAV